MTRTVLLLLSCAALLQSGCACPRGAGRGFDFQKDTFGFANELRWEYEFAENGEAVTHRVEPPPQYSLRCFPMLRAAREMFYHAEFRPDLARTSQAEYRAIVKEIMRRSSRCPAKEENRIVVPGFADVRAFSAEYEDLLKAECGGASRSFCQRGNWRMVFPVSKTRERRTAERFLSKVRSEQLPIAHVYRFPNTSLNHALLIYAAQEAGSAIIFLAYDPNDPERPATLTFDRSGNTFLFERNRYFAGGPVKVYEVYTGVFY